MDTTEKKKVILDVLDKKYHLKKLDVAYFMCQPFPVLEGRLRRYEVQQKIVDAVIKIQSLCRMRIQKKKYAMLKGRVLLLILKIQKKAKRFLKLKREEKIVLEKVIKIQSFYRGHMVRKRILDQLGEKIKSNLDMI